MWVKGVNGDWANLSTAGRIVATTGSPYMVQVHTADGGVVTLIDPATGNYTFPAYADAVAYADTVVHARVLGE